jgi:hypothetical protein
LSGAITPACGSAPLRRIPGLSPALLSPSASDGFLASSRNPIGLSQYSSSVNPVTIVFIKKTLRSLPYGSITRILALSTFFPKTPHFPEGVCFH